MLKGMLEGCILEIINKQETYAYEISEKLKGYGFGEISEGTVYHIILRLQKNELISATIRGSNSGPKRKYYNLTLKGSDSCVFTLYLGDIVNMGIIVLAANLVVYFLSKNAFKTKEKTSFFMIWLMVMIIMGITLLVSNVLKYSVVNMSITMAFAVVAVFLCWRNWCQLILFKRIMRLFWKKVQSNRMCNEIGQW